ncbi:Rieske 2Fe-2S domain-containing protein [Rhodocyclus tenuis]|uniref:aromatic ring-hydroxylating oxygenase subunit alpha n=1 Tax=Rhodocyclus gracilis TaxID=2929842 RepID=UPI001298972B|nr:aromatic ring-hydroxylating dioxygenase subunit alpha [Rhodocyclus gracilis]MRD73145.1 Rieske 2Fe-2S domain-containing protein [Rhodocyclus gracilis]
MSLSPVADALVPPDCESDCVPGCASERASDCAADIALPAHCYSDEALFAVEQEVFFAAGPGYVGHELMVPEIGDYRSLEWFDHAQLLVRGDDGVRLLSNVCRHRQAIMLQGQGKAKRIVCPLHRWAYDTDGDLVGAPRFKEKPCLSLRRQAVQSWQGLLFAGPRPVADDLAALQGSPFDFSGYRLDRVVLHDCDYNWKTFIEVYLEDYHVAPFHPGLGNFVTCDDLHWQFGTQFSVQRVGLTRFERSGSPAYARWQQAVRDAFPEAPPQGAVWLTLYPNVMLEWYPNTLVVSSLIPLSPGRTRNVVEFYYPAAVVAENREFVEAQQAAYLETAVEDDEIGERMDRGRQALVRQGRSEVGPYQSPLEDGMRHFHEYYRRVIAASPAGAALLTAPSAAAGAGASSLHRSSPDTEV